MGKSLSDLAKDARSWKREVRKAGSNYASQFAVNIVIELATDTPVDTSEAISNWQLKVGMRIETDIPPYLPGYMGSTYNYSKNAAIAAAKRNIKEKQPGQTIYISNLAEHIVELNEGSSKQAPAGFIEAAIIRARNKTKGLK